MKWFLEFNGQRLDKVFESKAEAEGHLQKLGEAFGKLYRPVPDVANPKIKRMLTEGLKRGDLRRIILPQISIDEYVPADPDTDNVVIAFYVKGVPEAIIPFRDFVMKCGGVIDVSYGDSDTIPDTSVIYTEFERSTIKYDLILNVIKQVALVAELEVSDFTTMFPTSNRRFPFGQETIEQYFNKRTEEDNWQAQQQALGAEDQEEEVDVGTDDGATR